MRHISSHDLRRKGVQFLAAYTDGAVLFLFAIFFRNALAWLGRLVTGADIQPIHVVIVAAILAVAVCFLRHRHPARITQSRAVTIALIAALSLDLLNTALWHTFILSASAAILAGYALLGWFMEQRHWRRGWFLAIVVLFTLPFIEHIQTFLGFPVRVFTASIVSHLMNLMGVESISSATVILTENNASVVDLPCSGVKSLYTGALFLCGLYFFQRVTLSLRLLLITAVYLVSLLALNIWRVFSLVYLYDVLQFTDIANHMHVIIGIGGFIASGLLALWLTTRFLPRAPRDERTHATTQPTSTKVIIIPLCILLAFLAVDTVVATIYDPVRDAPNALSSDRAFNIAIPGTTLNPLSLTEQEKIYFENREVSFAQKYAGQTNNGTAFTLLLVKSASWRTHHNPEVCLQGMGERIVQTHLIRLPNSTTIREVRLDRGHGTALYWFIQEQDGKILADYSERVWQGLLNPGQPWTLVEIGLAEGIDTRQEEITELINAINHALQQTDHRDAPKSDT